VFDAILGVVFGSDGIPAGSGILTVIEYSDGGDEACLIDVIISDSNAQALLFDIGGCIAIPDTSPDCQLAFALNTDGNLDVSYSSSEDIAGFQFDIPVSSPGIMMTGASGGAAEAAGFTVEVTSNLSYSRILGVSFVGDIISAGNGVLTTLSYTGSGDACFNNLTISDTNANAISISIRYS
jgi:hypothetical protein